MQDNTLAIRTADDRYGVAIIFHNRRRILDDYLLRFKSGSLDTVREINLQFPTTHAINIDYAYGAMQSVVLLGLCE